MTIAVPNSSREQDFLDWFSKSFQGKGLESRFTFGSIHSYCTSFSENFQGHEIAGHGYDADSSVSTLKGAAELIERRTVIEYFRRHEDELFKNSNGWAVHLANASAVASAQLEALERHILLYTYLRSGWNEFVLLDQRADSRGSAAFLASPFSQNGIFAGMVIYRPHQFPGVSFGHFADDVTQLQHSPRWNHSLFEAIGYVERSLETGGFSRKSDNAIYNECRDWIFEPWIEPEWQKALPLTALPDLLIETETGLVSDLTPAYPGLHYAYVKPGNHIPLFTQADLANPARKAYLTGILAQHGLALGSGRSPIL